MTKIQTSAGTLIAFSVADLHIDVMLRLEIWVRIRLGLRFWVMLASE